MDHHREERPDPTAGQGGDEAFARLSAADPAGDTHLDTTALRAEVARRTAAVGAATAVPPAVPPADGTETMDGMEGADGVEEMDGTAVPGASVTTLASRRRTRWLQAAAVAAGVALVGSGGYALGSQDDATVAADAITLGGAAAPEAASADSAAGSATDMRIAPGFGLRAVFTASGLSDDAGTGRSWALDAAAVFSAETAARVASVLGVAGEPTLQWGSWTVGPQDGTGPTVSVQPDGTASISYYDPTRDPWSCAASSSDETGGGASTSSGAAADPDAAPAEPGAAETSGGAAEQPGATTIDPAPPSATLPACEPALGDAPAGDAAVAATRDVLGSLGVDPGMFEYEVGDSGGDSRATSVSAFAVVDGQRTGLSWSVTLVGEGVQSLFGSLAPLVELGEYPVVGAATAVGRLNDPRFGAGSGGVMPLAREAVADTATEVAPDTTAVAPSEDPTVPATVRPGSTIPWPVQQVTITGARLGLTLLTQADGAAVLVPAYELTDSDGTAWSVIAVDESSLDLAG